MTLLPVFADIVYVPKGLMPSVIIVFLLGVAVVAAMVFLLLRFKKRYTKKQYSKKPPDDSTLATVSVNKEQDNINR